MEKLLEVVRRSVALMFAAVYVQTHHSHRDSALRVAGLAYRFMKGEAVEVINESADVANALREHSEQRNHLPTRQTVWPDFRKKKEQNHG